MNYPLHPVEKEISIDGLYTVYYIEHSKDYFTLGERHDFWELVYVDDGEIDVIADTTGYHLKQGEVIFHKPMEFHALASDKRDPHRVLIITFPCLSPAMQYFENKILTVQAEQKRLLSSFMREMDSLYGDSLENARKPAPIGAFQLMVSYVEELLLSMIRTGADGSRARHSSLHSKKNVENVLADQIEAYLRSHVYHALSLDDVCRQFHMSRSYLCRIFKEAFETSMIDWLIQLKIQEAKKLIRRGECNLTQIAEQLSYTSIHHFSRSFKKVTGLAPSAYLKSIRD